MPHESEISEVMFRLAADMARHRTALERALINPRKGVELEAPDDRGNIASRGCNQFELRHLLYQVLGDPDTA
jgi:hypothetical protein